MRVREKRSGPKAGKPLSQYLWCARLGAVDSCYEGTINEMLLKAFATPARPAELLPDLVPGYIKKFNPPASSISPRNYLSQRLYELKRRGLMEITK